MKKLLKTNKKRNILKMFGDGDENCCQGSAIKCC